MATRRLLVEIVGDDASLQVRLDALQPRLVNANTADLGFATTALSSGTWTQWNCSWDGSAGVYRLSGAANGTASGTGAYNMNRFVGGRGAGGGTIANFFDGDLALLMEYAGVHNTTHRQAVEAWITGIWGV